MTMNRRTAITKDPFKKCTYFLSLVEGLATKGWVMASNDWLEEAQDDPTILPPFMNTWHVLQAKFSKAFTNYTNQEKAYDELNKLQMKGSNINSYIADFCHLARDARIHLDDVNNL
jgi:hypothetical protein